METYAKVAAVLRQNGLTQQADTLVVQADRDIAAIVDATSKARAYAIVAREFQAAGFTQQANTNFDRMLQSLQGNSDEKAQQLLDIIYLFSESKQVDLALKAFRAIPTDVTYTSVNAGGVINASLEAKRIDVAIAAAQAERMAETKTEALIRIAQWQLENQTPSQTASTLALAVQAAKTIADPEVRRVPIYSVDGSQSGTDEDLYDQAIGDWKSRLQGRNPPARIS